MLTVGITLMVVSVVVGVITLVSVALMSSTARTAARRARTTVSRSGGKDGSSHQDRFRSTERDGRSEPAEEEPPRWVLGLTIISGAGLVLGLLLVMIPSIT